MNKDLIRLMRKVKKGAECWEWQGAKKPKGYGNFWLNGKSWNAHRAAWVLNFGAIQEGLCVCHTCDNPSCVNPSHLFLGSLADNFSDMRSKGREPGMWKRGENHTNAKLSNSDVDEIRRMRHVGMKLKKIAQDKNTSVTNVSVICSLKSRI